MQLNVWNIVENVCHLTKLVDDLNQIKDRNILDEMVAILWNNDVDIVIHM